MRGDFGDTKELIEIKEIKSNTVILKNGSLRQILIVGGINFSLKSEEEQQVILSAYQNFLNSLEFPIQIVIHSRRINIEKYINNLIEIKNRETSPLLQSQIEEYIEFIRGFVKENSIMSKNFFVIVPFSPTDIKINKGFIDKIPFFSSTKNKPEAKESTEEKEDFEHNLSQINQRTSRIIEGLASMGLDAMLLNDEQLIELFYNYYNPETVEKESSFENK
jgi:type IV secretory pathway VirB4 component